MADPRVKELDDQSNTWLIVSIVGFWLGFGFGLRPGFDFRLRFGFNGFMSLFLNLVLSLLPVPVSYTHL
ncbi:MAG: hypothetical protein KUG77_01285, partial [Nannocystaceae bacterium]|nr:hypothetical protein [Nannocystaceae bacterium]